MQQAKQTVLVTGISGYIAAETAYQLFQRGYKVRGTVRSTANQKKCAPIRSLHPAAAQNLELVEADLTKEDGWEAAINGVDYILHIASPFVIHVKKANDLIIPAVNGTKFVLNTAAKCPSVKGIVMTSSIAAIMVHKYDKYQHTYDEKDWTKLKLASAYQKSKTLAEQEAWKIWGELDESSRFKLATILPGFVVGPQRIDSQFESANLICEGLSGKFPSLPNITFPTVHVSDVAKAHIMAMEKFDIADGNRFVTVEKTYTFKEIFEFLVEFRKYGYKVPTSVMKKCTFGLAAMFMAKLRPIKKMVGRRINADNKKICEMLGMEFKQCGDGVTKMGYQCILKGLVKDKTEGQAQKVEIF